MRVFQLNDFLGDFLKRIYEKIKAYTYCVLYNVILIKYPLSLEIQEPILYMSHTQIYL